MSIEASTVVELAVKRSHKFMRPTSIDVVPSTPVLTDRKDRTTSITGPQPVDVSFLYICIIFCQVYFCCNVINIKFEMFL